MKKWLNTKNLILTLILLLCGISVFSLNKYEKKQTPSSSMAFERANVVRVVSEDLEEDEDHNGIYRGSQDVELKVLTGSLKGETHIVKNYVSALYNVLRTWYKGNCYG